MTQSVIACHELIMLQQERRQELMNDSKPPRKQHAFEA